jgi:hypothetical protein
MLNIEVHEIDFIQEIYQSETYKLYWLKFVIKKYEQTVYS